jgi:hypothetical protein
MLFCWCLAVLLLYLLVQVAATTCVLNRFDITTMTKEDAAFSAPFSIKVTRNDYIHALVAFFDVSFTACHKAINMCTGPGSRPTHWKQTVFYLEDVLTVSRDCLWQAADNTSRSAATCAAGLSNILEAACCKFATPAYSTAVTSSHGRRPASTLYLTCHDVHC